MKFYEVRERLTRTAENVTFLKIVCSVNTSTAFSVSYTGFAYALSSLDIAFTNGADDSERIALALLNADVI